MFKTWVPSGVPALTMAMIRNMWFPAGTFANTKLHVWPVVLLTKYGDDVPEVWDVSLAYATSAGSVSLTQTLTALSVPVLLK